jgi:AraC family transcriptional regulator
MQFSNLSLIVWRALLIAWISLPSRSFAMTSTQQVSTAEALWRGFTMRCPNCGTLVETSALALAARLAHSYAEPASVRLQGSSSHRLDEIRLRRVLDYIAQHLDEDITVAQLANVACLSPFHFARMFKAAMGAAPHRYVSQQRLENAMMLLAAGKRPLSDIALICQFSSQASFNRAFRRATGVTPGEYRRARR